MNKDRILLMEEKGWSVYEDRSSSTGRVYYFIVNPDRGAWHNWHAFVIKYNETFRTAPSVLKEILQQEDLPESIIQVILYFQMMESL